MISITEAFEQFLADTDGGSPSRSSADRSILDAFRDFLNIVGYRGAAFLDWSSKPKEYDASKPFCDTDPPKHINVLLLALFVNEAAPKHLKGDEAALAACESVITRLVAWLVAKGHWNAATADEVASPLVRGLVSDMCARNAFGRALHQHVENHPAEPPSDLSKGDLYDGKFIICKVEPGKLYLDFVGGPLDHVSVDHSYEDAEGLGPEWQTDVVLTLPRAVTDKARRDWTFVMRIARICGEWAILRMENVDE